MKDTISVSISIVDAEIVSSTKLPEKDPILFVCGHSIYSNAVIYFVAREFDVESTLALHSKLNEADGLLLDLYDQGTIPQVDLLSSLV